MNWVAFPRTIWWGYPMKALAIVLTLSLVGNAAWILHHFRETAARSGDFRAGGVRVQAGAAGSVGGASDGKLASESNDDRQVLGADGKAISPHVWSQLFGGDIKGLVARLKSAGFPDSMIRTIVVAEVGNQFNERRKSLVARMNADAYWRNASRGSMDPAAVEENLALQREYAKLIKELLSELPPDTGYLANAFQRRMYGNLSPEKTQQLNQINSDYSELSQEIHRNARGLLLAEDREKLAYLEKEKQADIEKLLTPSERMEYELRSSQLANSLRGRFNGFEPSEAEFRAIYSAAKSGGDVAQVSSPAGSRGQNDAILNAIKATLTPERFSEWERMSNPSYATASRLAARLNLPVGTADRLVAIEKDTVSQAAAIRSNAALTNAQRTAQLSELSARATQQLTGSLGGERGMEAYRQYGGGWLRSIANQQGSGTIPAVRFPGR